MYRRIRAIRLTVSRREHHHSLGQRRKLNIGGMIDYDSHYHGFCSTESMTSERIADFLDRFSLTIRKDTFVVPDNAKVHRSKYMKEMRKIWEKRGFIFSSCLLIHLI